MVALMYVGWTAGYERLSLPSQVLPFFGGTDGCRVSMLARDILTLQRLWVANALPLGDSMAELDTWLAGLERILEQMNAYYKSGNYGSIGM